MLDLKNLQFADAISTLPVNAVRTSGIAGSTGDKGRRAALAWTSPGTRCEREGHAAIHRGHSRPTARRCSRRRIRPPPTPARQEHTSRGRLQPRQGGSSSRLLFGSSPAINICVANIVPASEEGARARARAGKNRKSARPSRAHRKGFLEMGGGAASRAKRPLNARYSGGTSCHPRACSPRYPGLISSQGNPEVKVAC
jgi:hypothetical protein